MIRLRNMFLALGVVVLSGTVYKLAVLKPEFSTVDAVDAGVLTVSNPAQVRCRVRVAYACRGAGLAADGGFLRPRYAVVKLKARIVDATNPNTLLLDPDRSPDGARCLEPVGTMADACEVIQMGSCTDPAVCAPNAQPVIEANQCACRAAAGICLKGDGGPAPFGATLRASIEGFGGAGCRRFYCGPELNGEQGDSWPEDCPQ